MGGGIRTTRRFGKNEILPESLPVRPSNESLYPKKKAVKDVDRILKVNQHPSYRAEIPPVPDGVARPFWSVMIPTYHCARFLRQTLESVLIQDPGPVWMQIEVVDDGSILDDPGAVVAEVGQGRVHFYRQAQN